MAAVAGSPGAAKLQSVEARAVPAQGCAFIDGPADVVIGHPSGRVVAELYAAEVQVTLGVDGRPSSMVANVGGFHFDGAVVDDRDMPVFARAPLALGGVYDPEPDTALRWRMTASGLSVMSPASADVHELRPITQRVDCTQVGILPRSAQPRRSPAALRVANTRVRVGIAPRRGEPAVAELPADHAVTVLKEEDGAAFIWDEASRGGTWFGWVPRSALGLPTPEPSEIPISWRPREQQPHPLYRAADIRGGPIPGLADKAIDHSRSGLMSRARCVGRCPSARLVERPDDAERWTCAESVSLYAAPWNAAAPVRVGTLRAGTSVALDVARPQERFRRLVREQRPSGGAWHGSLVRAPHGFDLVIDAAVVARACTRTRT